MDKYKNNKNNEEIIRKIFFALSFKKGEVYVWDKYSWRKTMEDKFILLYRYLSQVENYTSGHLANIYTLMPCEMLCL